MSKVVVTADLAGNIIGLSANNPEYGYIRVEQTARQVSEGGWFKLVKRSALLKGKVEDLKQAGFKKGDELPGNIIVKESLTPFNPDNPDKHLKIAGETGVPCCVDGQPIYRDTIYTIDPYQEDEFIAHDNTDAIKAAQASAKALKELMPVSL